jgi:hypothetical protein
MTDNRIPIDQAVKQVSEQLGMDESAVRAIAEAMPKVAGFRRLDISPEVSAQLRAVVSATRAGAKAANEMAESMDSVRRTLSGVELANRRVLALNAYRRADPLRMPANPHDRRTFRVLGKPYYLAQTKGGLRLQPGESPWT